MIKTSELNKLAIEIKGVCEKYGLFIKDFRGNVSRNFLIDTDNMKDFLSADEFDSIEFSVVGQIDDEIGIRDN
ncbi:hypothetical protein [Parasphingorhabdus sp.]|uniref:hypothetical protein n=1 Tax=Parasphingorhabdus sp. TaxID=2709688 RepID=UPI003A8D66BE